ncbi:MAG: 2-hydroxyacyl-CoA dehydratase family protein [Lachnospiraceae bacterium]|nr:2-hydroxyacyl-CoA dehydratase family protein [Lachnospiraceae bacterium]
MEEKFEHDEYYEEWNTTINTLYQQNGRYLSIRYFLDLRYEFMQNYLYSAPKIIVLGLNIPEQLMYALSDETVYVLGGSLYAANLSEQMVPRDTDSCIKSVLGILKSGIFKVDKETIVIVPITCDSMRKIPALLKDNMRVITIEVPSTQYDKKLEDFWIDEIRDMVYKIKNVLNIKNSKDRIFSQIEQSKRAYKAFTDLDTYLMNDNEGINGAMKMFIAQSYFWTSDKYTWTENVYGLINEMSIQRKYYYEEYRPRVLMIGSPIYAPNYKIPFLLEELGLDLKQCIHPLSVSLFENNNQGIAVTTAGAIKNVARESFFKDLSPAYVQNDVLSAYIRYYIENYHFDGVVYHILKGQIEYDFELRRFEEYFEEYNIPVFRLETDYNYQDVEQLRIRLEAFSEMLQHRYKVLRQGA